MLTINEMVGRYRNVGRIEETRCVKPDPTISREWETRSSPDRICIASDMHLTAVYDTLLTLSCPLRVCCRTNTQANTDNSLQSESQLSANNWGLDVRANFGFNTPTFNRKVNLRSTVGQEFTKSVAMTRAFETGVSRTQNVTLNLIRDCGTNANEAFYWEYFYDLTYSDGTSDIISGQRPLFVCGVQAEGQDSLSEPKCMPENCGNVRSVPDDFGIPGGCQCCLPGALESLIDPVASPVCPQLLNARRRSLLQYEDELVQEDDGDSGESQIGFDVVSGPLEEPVPLSEDELAMAFADSFDPTICESVGSVTNFVLNALDGAVYEPESATLELSGVDIDVVLAQICNSFCDPFCSLTSGWSYGMSELRFGDSEQFFSAWAADDTHIISVEGMSPDGDIVAFRLAVSNPIVDSSSETIVFDAVPYENSEETTPSPEDDGLRRRRHLHAATLNKSVTAIGRTSVAGTTSRSAANGALSREDSLVATSRAEATETASVEVGSSALNRVQQSVQANSPAGPQCQLPFGLPLTVEGRRFTDGTRALFDLNFWSTAAGLSEYRGATPMTGIRCSGQDCRDKFPTFMSNAAPEATVLSDFWSNVWFSDNLDARRTPPVSSTFDACPDQHFVTQVSQLYPTA